MAKYRIEVAQSAEKLLHSLSKQVLPQIIKALLNLSNDAHPAAARKLGDQKNIYRLRVGAYRILYEVGGDLIVVKVLKKQSAGQSSGQTVK